MAFPAGDQIVIDEAALRAFLESEDGPVVAELMRRGQNVESLAKTNATGAAPLAGAENPGLRGPRVDTGRLRSSISHAPGRGPNGVYVDVGTNVHYGHRLEVGWMTAKSGFRRYPFLVPALPAAAI